MRRYIIAAIILLAVLVMGVYYLRPHISILGGGSNKSSQSDSQKTVHFRALVFSKTTGFRHDSIPVGVAAIKELGSKHNFTVVATEDAASFNDSSLAKYKVVIWLSTTGNVLDDTQQAAFERFIKNNGGYVGIHAASDTEYDWEWYGGLVGAYFKRHPPQQSANVIVEDVNHPSTVNLPPAWNHFDEWYDYRVNPRGTVNVLLRIDEASYSGGQMGTDHPIAWCRNYSGGRVWYTGLGHTDASYSEPAFLQHLLGGIRTAAGVVASDCAVHPLNLNR